MWSVHTHTSSRRETERAQEEAALLATDQRLRRWGNIFSTPKLRKRRRHLFFELRCAGPNRFKAVKNAAQSPGSFSRSEFLEREAEPQTVEQCAPHAAVAALRESGAFHNARANAGFDVPFGDSVCFDGVSGFLQALPLCPPVRTAGHRPNR